MSDFRPPQITKAGREAQMEPKPARAKGLGRVDQRAEFRREVAAIAPFDLYTQILPLQRGPIVRRLRLVTPVPIQPLIDEVHVAVERDLHEQVDTFTALPH